MPESSHIKFKLKYFASSFSISMIKIDLFPWNKHVSTLDLSLFD